MMTRNFGMGFFGRRFFSEDMRKRFYEEWSKMTDKEKLEFMNKRMDAWNNNEDHFSVEAINNRCEEWMKMTSEEKEQFVNEKKSFFQNRGDCFKGFPGHGNFDSGFYGEKNS